jgi:hypothetical protein
MRRDAHIGAMVAVALAVLMAAAFTVGAQEQAPAPPPATEAPAPPGPPGPPMMGPGMPPMAGMGMMGGMGPGMMQGMMPRVTLNVTRDGVYLLVGHLLQKYDRNLKLVKETYIPLDVAAIGHTMRECMENCPMQQGMRGPGMMQGGPMRQGRQPAAAPRGRRAAQRAPGRARALNMMGMCPICAAIHGLLMQTAVAVADGDTYVWAGGKLMKYDRDLNLVKQAEVKIDFAKIHEKMQEMMKYWPPMQQQAPRARRAAPRAPRPRNPAPAE